MAHKARMLLRPPLYMRLLVRPVVVHHQVQLEPRGKLIVQAPQKSQPFLMPMSAVTLSYDLPSNTFSAANNVVVPLRL